ncbi:prepilin-type N-terminal cleavage/methylation domain-containing protein [Weissella coleopterorum]|uniref:prepilin-type N-terminal cleavage/methylation domain-containing protein n=1 Tax=Weissella coleopterorum TaxID=2714949 RepID=UPI001FE73F70|nr:prepilin-type N-terminal cleavage/methylation domain-containing protein [Weissella coleopterorum]
MKNRFGFTLIEIMITLFLTCTILSTFTYCGANKVPKQNWIKFKKELQFEVDRVRNISQPGQIIIEGCEEKKNRAIMVQKKNTINYIFT